MDKKQHTPADTAIAALNALTSRDKEQAHIDADKILLRLLEQYGQQAVITAYIAASDRVGFFYI